ncbi:MAG: ribosome maturation factor RimM [Thermoanaerobaculia bacterium]|nr:ribosome maturation factor RimM [Thermoanaerobaculia bacterium]
MGGELPDTVRVGKIVKPHGLRGDLVVEASTDVAERFAPGSMLTLAGPRERRLEVARCRVHKGLLLVAFAGLESRDDVEGLRGLELVVARQDVPAAPPGSYYYFELVGCACRDESAGDLGRVVDVVEDGGGLILEIERGSRKLLVPFVNAYLVEVDVAGRRIALDLPPGLIETCEST